MVALYIYSPRLLLARILLNATELYLVPAGNTIPEFKNYLRLILLRQCQ